ncbi:BZ3500_MvSof-1268-A1-R1_Chr1-1g01000 [Microbotryum saponariae]|uniref:BZ3500_MvSof-1268-A1-R1_Chr1-1g01000 protein n=1 Tax=Microbotryum saponariae TaxID=289078 RepID=A0A2X0LBE3_9BASI|nr:BZ3500_MvSof-1268-A1-R1_Chr1-1g01000 [Microbotryum saponariae]SCZ93143.1 BZ3501_MvSof-1269-A2-R1_Chr1-1g00597 [Microbotryum saponariae]
MTADIRTRSAFAASTSSSAPRPIATPVPLHQRILYPSPSPHGPRPPRILHAAAHTELDPLILDLIALICREHVLSWYSSISRDPERAFVQQVTSILVHVIQALEVRLAHVDFVQLLAVDLPALLETHVRDWDKAMDKAHTGHAHNFDRDNVFHLLQPHIAVTLQTTSGAGKGMTQVQVDPTYLRALVDHLLRLLLPPEDYRAETNRAITREIIVNVILGNVFNRVAQPWFVYSAITKIIVAQKSSRVATGVPDKSPSTTPSLPDRILATISSIPPVFRALSASLSTLYHTTISSPVPPHYRHQPPLASPWISFLLVLLPSSPLLAQVTHYLSLLLSLFSSFITSLTFYLINNKLCTGDLVKTVLESTTQALFPNGHSPPKEPDPNEAQQEEIKKGCEEAIAGVLPKVAVRMLVPLSGIGADKSSSAEDELARARALARHLMRSLDSHVANVHLFVLVLDLIVGRVFPELVVPTEDRFVDFDWSGYFGFVGEFGAANAAAGNRWQQRNRGSFVPRSELSSEQQAILAAVPTFKRTWVRPSFLKPHQRPNYKICKWVIDATPSTRMEFEKDTTSERGALQTTGASTVQNSTPTPTPTPVPISAVIDLTGGATTPIPIPVATSAPAPAPIVVVQTSVEAAHTPIPIPIPAPTTSTTTTTVIVPPTTTLDPPVPSVPSASKPAQGTPPSEPTAHQQIIEAVKDVQGNEVQKIEETAVEDVEMKDGAGGGEDGPTKELVEDGLQVANEATEGVM